MPSSETSPVVSVIIPVHNNADHLAAQLDGVASGITDAPATEVLVVDNRSTDGSADIAVRWSDAHPEVDLRVVSASDRPGEPYARNVGFSEARGERILYCDGDDVVSGTWLSGLAGALSNNNYATGPIDMAQLNEPWLADVRGASVTGQSFLYDTVPYAHGCSMGFRRELLDRLGGFDEGFTAGCDLDIAIRAWRAGEQMAFVPEAVVHYRLRPSLGDTWRQGRSYGRYRVRLRDQLHESIDVSGERRANVRRLGWLARNAPKAIASKSVRARWVWVASQLIGETQGELDARHT